MPFTRLNFCSREFYLFFHSLNGFAKTGIYQLEGSNIHRTFSLWLLRLLLQSNIFIIFTFLRYFYNWLIRIFTGHFLSSFFKIIFSRNTNKVEWKSFFLRLFFCLNFTADGIAQPLDDGSAHKSHRKLGKNQRISI